MIGETDCGFHAVALVEYPSRKKFVEIAQSAEVAGIGVHRAAGLGGKGYCDHARSSEVRP